jgi:phosphomannomutase
MRENNALLGIEKSGHYYWKEFFFADSGIYSFLMLLIFLANKKGGLNNLVAEFVQKQIILPEINFKIKSQKKMDKNFKEVEKAFCQNKINKEDGLTVFGKNFKFNLKNSQTELNVLRLNIEAKNKDVLDNKLAIIKKIINKYK